MIKKIFFSVVVFLLSSAVTLGQGCSQCKLLAEQNSEMMDEASFGSNINSGILYLMVIPYLIIMFIFRKQIANFFKSVFGKKA